MDTTLTLKTLQSLDPPGLLQLPEDHYAILYPSEGSIRLVVNDQLLEVGPGLALFVHPNYPCSLSSLPKDGWLLLFKKDLLTRFFWTYPDCQTYALFQLPGPKAAVVSGACEQLFHLLLLSIEEQQANDRTPSIAWHLLSAILLHLCESCQLTNGNPVSVVDQTLSLSLIKLIDTHFKEQHVSGFYAAQLSMTVRQLNQLSRRSLGKTTSQLIDERILTEAKRLLVETKMQIKEIAYELGFSTPSGFMHFFKKLAHITPNEFRTSLLRNIE